MNTTVKSANRVLDLLELLSASGRPLRLREIVKPLGFPKSSTHGLLATLVDRGYVVKDDADQYGLVEAFRDSLAWVGGFEARLKAIAMPLMQAASIESGETVFLSVPNGKGDARLMCKVVSRQPIRYDSEGDRPTPGYATVMGRVLLAYADPKFVNDYLARTELNRYTANSVTSKTRLRAILAAIRKQGYGTIEEEYAVGGCGIAVPVRNAKGAVVAALDIATVTQRWEAQRDRLHEIALDTAARLSQRMGWRPNTDVKAG